MNTSQQASRAIPLRGFLIAIFTILQIIHNRHSIVIHLLGRPNLSLELLELEFLFLGVELHRIALEQALRRPEAVSDGYLHRDDASIASSFACPFDDDALLFDFAAQCRCEEL